MITGSADISLTQLAVSPLNQVNFNSPFNAHRSSSPFLHLVILSHKPAYFTECLFKQLIDTTLCVDRGLSSLLRKRWLSCPRPPLQTSSSRKS